MATKWTPAEYYAHALSVLTAAASARERHQYRQEAEILDNFVELTAEYLGPMTPRETSLDLTTRKFPPFA